ncbi:hypothetical protein HUT06_21560 [Actinomadura sp. NAK00032]|uniref:hypothetical protein n=1 Tax=Actinomadura sp. NAK00032 TaxID=2742128 RepID=UPI0015921B90|nr:hypothetical protein [Actinomadura sp. NAK00032]QKW36299.1 hypothetical protein HUT06_21560 [Actinomadura sp. NAK00032]
MATTQAGAPVGSSLTDAPPTERPPAEEPPPEEPQHDGAVFDTAATRYLCAGTYLDDRFRGWVLTQVYGNTASRVAPSYGFDVVPVVAHARRAWGIAAAQDAILTALLVFAGWYLTPSTAFLCTLAYLWFLLVNVRDYAKQWTVRFFRLPHRKPHPQESLILKEERRRIRDSTVFLLPLTAGAFAVTLWRGWGIVDVALGAVVIIGVTGFVLGLAELARRRSLRALWSDFEPVPLNRRLKAIDVQQRSPVVAHVDDPFIGSGQIVHTWEFTQRLLRPRDDAGGRKGSEFADPPFRTSELVRHIRESLNRLARDRGRETKLPGLRVSDLLLVEGRHLGRYRSLLNHRPRLEELEEFMADSLAPGRHHLACQITSWDGEIVTTVYLHTSLQGGLLYLKYTIYALTPIPERFKVINEMGNASFNAAAKVFLGKLLSAPRALRAPRDLWNAVRTAGCVLTSPKDRTDNPRLNIGVRVSVREHLAATRDRSYFQAMDVAKHSKIIERRIISAVGEFLHGRVLTTEFEERATYILNSGVLNMGSGDVQIGNANTIGSAA